MKIHHSKLTKAIMGLVFISLASPAFAQFAKPNDITVDPIFYGATGFKTMPGSLALKTEGAVKQPFLSRKVTWARTGKSTRDAELTGTWGAIKIPAGSRFYAMPFKDGFPSFQKKAAEQGIKLPEVAWCTPDYKPEKGKPYCFFTDLSWKLNYASSGSGSAFYPEYMGVSQYNNIFDAPSIEETPVDFDRPLTLEVQIKKIKKKEIKLQIYLNDGTERSEVFWGDFDRTDDGSARVELWGGAFDILPKDKKTFEVREITPFKNLIMLSDEKLHLPYALRS